MHRHFYARAHVLVRDVPAALALFRVGRELCVAIAPILHDMDDPSAEASDAATVEVASGLVMDAHVFLSVLLIANPKGGGVCRQYLCLRCARP